MKILQGFTEKTEGSFITKKETIISWYYKDCDIYFGHIQANEINTHLQNIYENSFLDIVHGKGYVEIKPRNVNKGFFLSQILTKEFKEEIKPDFILAIGDDTSDEEMFKYVNSIKNNVMLFKESEDIYTCTIGRKPSSAQFYLNEVQEVIEYLESLNQINNCVDRFTYNRYPTSRNLGENLFLERKDSRKGFKSFSNLNKKFDI